MPCKVLEPKTDPKLVLLNVKLSVSFIIQPRIKMYTDLRHCFYKSCHHSTINNAFICCSRMNPISLWCSLDESASARGSLFMDDGESLSNIGIDILSFFDSSIYLSKELVNTNLLAHTVAVMRLHLLKKNNPSLIFTLNF